MTSWSSFIVNTVPFLIIISAGMALTELSGALHPHIESRDNIKIDFFIIYLFTFPIFNNWPKMLPKKI